MMIDPFKDGYSLTQLSQAINVLPNMYGRINELGLFTFRAQSTNTVTVEMNNGVLSLVQTTPWGGPAPKSKSGKRAVRSFSVPHTPLEDTVMAADVIGVRAFGTENTLETVAIKVNEKLQSMKNKIDQTMEWRKMSALKGVVLDADNSVIEDYFAAFGVVKKTVNFVLGNANTDVRAKCMEVVRHIEDNLKGESMLRAHVLVSQEFFDALVSHSKVKEAYANYSEAAQRIGGDMRKGFSFGGLTFEEYRGVVDGKRFIEAGDGHAFPIGTSETFSNFGAPADFVETVNTLALPYYARQQNKDFNRGIDLHVQANQLPLVNRPATIVELKAA
ncbi:MAG: major capsid protein [Burkholderiaceae bacterium]|nr:major capsid protein [Burkholderiaceae bacterium]